MDPSCPSFFLLYLPDPEKLLHDIRRPLGREVFKLYPKSEATADILWREGNYFAIDFECILHRTEVIKILIYVKYVIESWGTEKDRVIFGGTSPLQRLGIYGMQHGCLH